MADYGNSGIFNLFKSVGGNLPQLPTPPLVRAIEKGNKVNSSNNASDINKRLDQQKKEREAALARTKGNYDHSSGSYLGQDSGRQILPPQETVAHSQNTSSKHANVCVGSIFTFILIK